MERQAKAAVTSEKHTKRITARNCCLRVTTYRDRDTEYLSLLDFTLTFIGGVNENSFPF